VWARLTTWPRAQLVALIVGVGTPLAIAYHLLLYAAFDARYPWSTFLYRPGDRFADFYHVFLRVELFRPGKADTVIYTPFAHGFVEALTPLPPVVGFVCVIAAFLVTLVLVLWKWAAAPIADVRLRALCVVVLTMLAYPVIFTIDRGNLEMVVFLLLAVFFALYFGRHRRWAFLPLGLAMAFKYYWVVLLVLLLLDRRVLQAVYAAVVALVVNAAATLALGVTSGYGALGVLRALVATIAHENARGGGLFYVQHGHSVWGLILIFNNAIDFLLTRNPYLRALYLVLMLLLFALIVISLARRPRPGWQKAAVLVMCGLVFPFQNNDYALVQWMLVFALFAAAGPPGRRYTAVTVLFAVTMVPLAYYYLPFAQPDVGLSVLVYPAAMVATALLILTDRTPVPDLGALPDGDAAAPALPTRVRA